MSPLINKRAFFAEDAYTLNTEVTMLALSINYTKTIFASLKESYDLVRVQESKRPQYFDMHEKQT